MRITLLTTALALALAAHVAAQPAIEVDRAKLWVGEVLFRQPKKVTFGVRNRGDKPLLITEVTPSCGCVSVDWPQGQIAPGQSGVITAEYDAEQLGSFNRELEVWSNASDLPTYLTFQGRVVAQLSQNDWDVTYPIDLGNVRLSTNVIEFDDVNAGDRPMAEIKVLNVSREPFAPTLMHLPPHITAEYAPESIPGGGWGRMVLTLNSDKLVMPGLNQTSLYMTRYMGDKIGPDNEILVSAVLLPSFQNLTAAQMAAAPHIVLMDGNEMVTDTLRMSAKGKARKEKLTKTINVTNVGDSPLTINAVQVTSRALGVSLGKRVIPPHGTTRLKVTLHTQQVAKWKGKPRILIISDDPRHAKTQLSIIAD